MTGILAFILVGFYTAFVAPLLLGGGAGNAQMALVAFHTTFNIIGVIVVLPFAGRFAALITNLVPERGSILTTRLDERLIDDAPAAIDAAAATVRDIAADLFGILTDLLDPHLRDDAEQKRLEQINSALDETQYYLSRIQTDSSHTRAFSDQFGLYPEFVK